MWYGRVRDGTRADGVDDSVSRWAEVYGRAGGRAHRQADGPRRFERACIDAALQGMSGTAPRRLPARCFDLSLVCAARGPAIVARNRSRDGPAPQRRRGRTRCHLSGDPERESAATFHSAAARGGGRRRLRVRHGEPHAAAERQRPPSWQEQRREARAAQARQQRRESLGGLVHVVVNLAVAADPRRYDGA